MSTGTSKRAGRFITVEGIEGVGKTTNLQFIRDLIEEGGERLVVTREPGGTALGEEIREMLLDHRHSGMSPDAEMLLMFAARAEHIARVIRPALAAGIWVLCDRFTDATFAYQGGGRGIGFERVAVLADWVHRDLRPDLTLLLDLPVDAGLERAGRRNRADRFEQEELEFFERVRAAYLELAGREPDRIKLVPADPPLAQVQSHIRELLVPWMKARDIE